jgi:hypothetical protein
VQRKGQGTKLLGLSYLASRLFGVMAKRKTPAIRTGPSSDDAHEIVYFKRHSQDDPNEAMPCP